jgi:hypothetical protein
VIALAVAIGLAFTLAAASDREDGEDSRLVDVLIFVLCLGGILYKHHKQSEDEDF